MTARVPYVSAWDELKLLQRLVWELVWDDRGNIMCTTLATSLLFFVASLGATWAKMRCVPSSKLGLGLVGLGLGLVEGVRVRVS